MRFSLTLLILLPLLLLVTTCGQTGDLYLPEETEKQTTLRVKELR